MNGVVVEQKKAEHVRGDCVDAAVLERQLGFVNICFILTPVFVPCFLININGQISDLNSGVSTRHGCWFPA